MIKIGLKIAAIALIGHWLVAGLGARGDEFTEALNVQRFQRIRGLQPVASSPGLQSTAARNNAVQAVYGLGHFILEGYGQCATIDQPSCRSVLDSWLISGPHAAILLDPRIIAVGYHQLGVAHAVSVSWTPILELEPVTIDKATGKIVTSSPQVKPAGIGDKGIQAPGSTSPTTPAACPTGPPVAMTALPIKTIGPRGSCRGGWHPLRRLFARLH